ncbi:MAG: hypothetical protein BIFFINMI_01188 [Phycisphaerae bacterium]|nr:hypothetical protein [Phycisphaerae bacterium]
MARKKKGAALYELLYKDKKSQTTDKGAIKLPSWWKDRPQSARQPQPVEEINDLPDPLPAARAAAEAPPLPASPPAPPPLVTREPEPAEERPDEIDELPPADADEPAPSADTEEEEAAAVEAYEQDEPVEPEEPADVSPATPVVPAAEADVEESPPVPGGFAPTPPPLAAEPPVRTPPAPAATPERHTPTPVTPFAHRQEGARRWLSVSPDEVRLSVSPFAALIAVGVAICVLLLFFIGGYYRGRSVGMHRVADKTESTTASDNGGGSITNPPPNSNANDHPANPTGNLTEQERAARGDNCIRVQSTGTDARAAVELAGILNSPPYNFKVVAVRDDHNGICSVRTDQGWNSSTALGKQRLADDIERLKDALSRIKVDHPGLIGYDPNNRNTHPYIDKIPPASN